MSCALLIALCAHLSGSYSGLTINCVLLVAINLVLGLMVLRDTMRTRTLGKVLLVASTLYFFYVDALGQALESTPFATPLFLQSESTQFEPTLVSRALIYTATFEIVLFVGYNCAWNGPARWILRLHRSDDTGLYSKVVRLILPAGKIIPGTQQNINLLPCCYARQ